ncbi:hypothetical protein [Cellulomonas hominis]
MLWFAVWSLLVVGTLVAAFFLARDLWRKARALLAELERASGVLAAVADRAAELAEQAEAVAGADAGPDLFHDRDELRARRDRLRRERNERRARREARHKETIAGWSAIWR